MKNSDAQLQCHAAELGRILLVRNEFVATAESCTGGWIAKALTDVAGSSQWFGEGLVTYSNEAKHRLLGVPLKLLAAGGAVSESVVRAMALGVLERSGAHRAVAVSGIAGPGGAVPGKPVGTVWLCWSVRRSRGGAHLRTALHHFRGDRESVRRKTVGAALRGLLAS